ncbi:RNA polymerase sigma factor [Paraflavitalea pollutisoli]|uniref:RNA polymerase sigma factor n=1 Tax=Paraflavitalea pollutisoli TaxID=3034143 RepID=UPI0023EB94B9|nr:sigma-70 family RNA polymerase sigma factor [Paraflavitalea sp. H1-2-19X]
MDDQQILQLLKENTNDKALAALYRHFPMVRKMIRNYGGTPEDAADIFQEALIIVCTQARNNTLQLTARLSTYLYSVCKYLWKDEVKKRQRQMAEPLEEDLTPAQTASLDALREADQRVRLAEKVISELGDRCRELLMLFYEQGLKLRDIALRMGYSAEHTAKNQKYKCIEAAKMRLKELQQLSPNPTNLLP